MQCDFLVSLLDLYVNDHHQILLKLEPLTGCNFYYYLRGGVGGDIITEVQILFTFNVLDTTSKFHIITMFVITDL
jgi:hypothetical protein